MRTGERISGRYKIIRKIGSGGMANVYLAEDLILERRVAVKMMALDFQEDEQNLRRFRREALSTTELSHPNIVNIYDVGEGNQPYIVMEYIDGMDLKEYIRKNHPIPYHQVIDIMNQILDGIAYAHRNNVIHRDIKPHNILICNNGHVKITDFGIAVALSQNSITQTNSLLGSVQYISPEQARGNIVTKQSDIYSLGIVLYELLAGTVPFDGESAVSIALKHFQTEMPSLRELDSRLPQALENVVLKATAKEIQNRYETVDEMKMDLETVLSAARKHEEPFVPKDLNDEKTMVLNAAELKSATLPVSETAETITQKPASNKKKNIRLRLLALIPVVLIISFIVYFFATQPQQVLIPEEIIGLDLESAIELLEENKLELGEVFEQSNDEVEEGLIFRVNPKEGSTVLEGAEVNFYVSEGEKPYEVEDYTGKDYEEIRAKLTELGFEVSKEDRASNTVESGKIIEQNLTVGEEVIISDTSIKFIVSTGKPTFRLRDLKGYSQADVDNYIEQNGLKLTTEEKSSEDVPLGLVISQQPEADTSLQAGDRITVVYSTGPTAASNIAFTEEIELSYEEKYENPDDEESALIGNKIQIYVGDLNRDIKDLDTELIIKSDQVYNLNLIVKEGESAQYRILRDDELLIDKKVRPE